MIDSAGGTCGDRGGCPTLDEVDAFVDGRVSPEVGRALEAHIAACAACRALVSAVCRADTRTSVDRASSMADTLAASSPGLDDKPSGESAPFDALPIAGTQIGRYIMLEQLGAGGMGVVCAALDPELDRKVAIKILRTDGKNGRGHEKLEERLVKEARAMAQLAHPNVVAVFEIGRFRDQVFLAMELVDGHTLRRWLSAERRSWRKIVEVFVAAGQGLAAAHAAGLVHRDFKPANVLVGHDGRVRVTDFGLAQHSTRTAARAPIAGTPPYMAPEQFRGDPADPRTDQFNFCVALYRALYDQPPFPGDTAAELADAVIAGRLRPAPVGRAPRWLGRVVERGLATAPEDRHASMDELLRALRREPYRQLRRGLAVVAIAAIAIVAPLLYRGPSDSRPSCADTASRVTTVWGPERRQVIERAFSASGTPFAPIVFASVARGLDDYARTWTEMRIDLCEATRSAPTPADELAGLRGACLDRRLSELRALVSAFADASPAVVEKAPEAVDQLGDLADCADARTLLGPASLPSDPAERARIEVLRDELADAQALRHVGRYSEAFERAKALAGKVRATAFRPLEAEALLLVARAAMDSGKLSDCEPALNGALFAAEAGRSDQVAIEVLIETIYCQGRTRPHPEQAARDHARRVTALLERLGGNDELAGWLHVALAATLMGADHYDDGDSEGKLGLELLERRFGSSDPRIVPALKVRIWSALVRNDYPTAFALAQRMLAIQAPVYGDVHPKMAGTHHVIGLALKHTERAEEARAAFERAVMIRERTLAADHPDLAEALTALGNYDTAIGRFAEARACYERALAIAEKAGGAKSRLYGEIKLAMAQLSTELRRDVESLALLREAQSVLVQTVGANSLAMSTARMTMGEALMHLGRHAEARKEVQASLALLDQLFKPDHPWSALRYRILGRIELAAGRPRSALAWFERARGMVSAGDASFAPVRADIEFGIARTLDALHRDPARAARLARSARTVLAGSPELDDRVRQIDAWLARHPRLRRLEARGDAEHTARR